MKQIKYIIYAAVLFMINITCCFAATDKINKIDVDITLDINGNAHIVEVWDVEAKMGTEFYKAEYNLGNMTISNFEVYENGRKFTFINNWDLDASINEKAYKNGYNYINDGVELCWGKGSMGSHTFTISYDVSNFVFTTTDAQVVYWQIINQDMSSVPKNFTATIRGPQVFLDTLDVWGFGYKGYAYVKDGVISMSNEEHTSLKDGDYVVLLVKFDPNTFNVLDNNTYSNFTTFDDVLNRGNEGTFEYNYQATHIIFDIILPFIFSVLPFIIFVLIAVFSVTDTNYKYEKLGKKIDMKNIHNFRDIPCNKDVFRAFFLAKAYRLNKNDPDFIGTLFLKWLFNGNITIEKEENQGLFKNKTNQVIVLKNDVKFDNEVEKELYDILIEASKDYRLENNELEKWSKKHYYKLFNWLKTCEKYGRDLYVSEGLVYRTKNFGKYTIKDDLKSKAIELAGLKKYLMEFSRIKEREPMEVMLWKEYLMFAQIFGIADKVAESFKNLYPEVVTEMTNSDFDYTNIIILNSMSNHMASAAISARTAAQSYSGGGGGFSVGGGGGGSFGGGGGGGR